MIYFKEKYTETIKSNLDFWTDPPPRPPPHDPVDRVICD